MNRVAVASIAVAGGVLLGASSAHAESDAQLWMELDAGASLSRVWSVSFEQHLRFDQDVSRVSQVMPDIAVTARLARWARATAGYRLRYVRTGSGDFDLRHRFYLGGTARTDVGRDVRLSARLLFTEQVRDLPATEPTAGLRAKLSAGWRRYRKVRPEVSAESFLAIADPTGFELDKLRLGLAASTPVGPGDAGVGYRLDVLQRDQRDPTVHALVVSYSVELN